MATGDKWPIQLDGPGTYACTITSDGMVVTASNLSPRISIYQRRDVAAHRFDKIQTLAYFPCSSSSARHIRLAPDELNIVFESDSTLSICTRPTKTTKQWTENVLRMDGGVGSIQDFAFTPNGLGLLVIGSTKPFLSYFTRPNIQSTTWTKQANPPSPTSTAYALAVSGNGLECMVGVNAAPYLLRYTRSSITSTTWTQQSFTGIAPAHAVMGLLLSPDGRTLMVHSAGIAQYTRSSDTSAAWVGQPWPLAFAGTFSHGMFTGDGLMLTMTNGPSTANTLRVYRRNSASSSEWTNASYHMPEMQREYKTYFTPWQGGMVAVTGIGVFLLQHMEGRTYVRPFTDTGALDGGGNRRLGFAREDARAGDTLAVDTYYSI